MCCGGKWLIATASGSENMYTKYCSLVDALLIAPPHRVPPQLIYARVTNAFTSVEIRFTLLVIHSIL